MATTHYYVDPNLGSDTGDGTKATPWGRASGSVVQYALDTITQGTDGDQINVKDSGTDSLSSVLSLATYGTPSATQPLIFRGYTTDANDGGIGVIQGAGGASNEVLPNAGYSHYVDLEIDGNGTTSGTAFPADLSAGNQTIIGCKVHNAVGTLINLGPFSWAIRCEVTNGTARGIQASGQGGVIQGNYIYNSGARTLDAAVLLNTISCFAIQNIISIDSTTDGVRIGNDRCYVLKSSILSASGTGSGIQCSATRNRVSIVDNLTEGFSGTGGIAFEDAGTSDLYMFANNSEYNNATGFEARHTSVIDEGNESLGSSPFAKSGSDTFANRFTYFEPNDVGSVRGGAFAQTNLDRGAVQHADAAGGTTIIRRTQDSLIGR